MIYPMHKHTTHRSCRHTRRMTRAQKRERITFLRLLVVGGGVLLAISGAGIATNIPLSIFGTIIAMVASYGLVDDGPVR